MNEIEREMQKLTEALCVYRATKKGSDLQLLRKAVWAMEDAVDDAIAAKHIEMDCQLAAFKRQAFGL